MKLVGLIFTLLFLSFVNAHSSETVAPIVGEKLAIHCEKRIGEVDYFVSAYIKDPDPSMGPFWTFTEKVSGQITQGFWSQNNQFTISDENDYTFLHDYKMGDGYGWGYIFIRFVQREPGKYEAFYTSVHSYMSARNIVLANMDCGIAEKKLTLK